MVAWPRSSRSRRRSGSVSSEQGGVQAGEQGVHGGAPRRCGGRVTWADASGRGGPQRREGAEHGRRDGEEDERGQRAARRAGTSGAPAGAAPRPRRGGAGRRGPRSPAGRAPGASGRPSRSALAIGRGQLAVRRAERGRAARRARRRATVPGAPAARRRRTRRGAPAGRAAASSLDRLVRRAPGVDAQHEQLDGVGHRLLGRAPSAARGRAGGGRRRRHGSGSQADGEPADRGTTTGERARPAASGRGGVTRDAGDVAVRPVSAPSDGAASGRPAIVAGRSSAAVRCAAASRNDGGERRRRRRSWPRSSRRARSCRHRR